MFRVGDTIIHPRFGAGVVIDIKELGFLGNEKKQYYSIDLLGQRETVVMVPARRAAKVGLRYPVSESKLSEVWHILRTEPGALPDNHDRRCELLSDKLHGGDVVQIAEVLRDLAWRREEKRHLTIRGKRLYDEGMMFLAGEIASIQDGDLGAAEERISKMLMASLLPER